MHSNSQVSCAIAAILSTSAANISQSARAADAEPVQGQGIEEITVTAQRRSENMQDVPITIQALTGDMLALERSFKKISDELRSQYLITYKPANQNYDGRERKIEVRFTDKDKANNYKIRTKKSYRQIRDNLK